MEKLHTDRICSLRDGPVITTTTVGAWLIALNLIAVSIAGVIAGGATCVLRRRRLSLGATLIDAALSPAVALLFAFVVSELNVGGLGSLVMPSLVVAVLCVIARHLWPSRTEA